MSIGGRTTLSPIGNSRIETGPGRKIRVLALFSSKGRLIGAVPSTKLEIGQGEISYGTIEATPEGLAFLGNVGALRALADKMKVAYVWTDDELIERMPAHIQPPLWARPAE
jgi:uncharacterized protein (UPF0261 family)